MSSRPPLLLDDCVDLAVALELDAAGETLAVVEIAGTAQFFRLPDVREDLEGSVGFEQLPLTECLDAALSHDGARLAAVGPEVVLVWSVRDGSLVWRLETPHEVQAVAFTRDGKSLLTASGDLRLRRYDAASGKLLGEALFAGERNASLQLSPDGALVAVAAAWQGGATVRLAHADTLAPATPGEIPLSGDVASGAVFSPSGTVLAATDHALHLFGLPQGERLASVGADGRRAEAEGRLRGRASWARPAFVSETLVAASPPEPRGPIYLVAVPSGEVVATLERHTGLVTALAARGGRLVSAAQDHTLLLWNDLGGSGRG